MSNYITSCLPNEELDRDQKLGEYLSLVLASEA